jgi:hypothetical protein
MVCKHLLILQDYCNVHCVLEQLFTVFLWLFRILMLAGLVLHYFTVCYCSFIFLHSQTYMLSHWFATETLYTTSSSARLISTVLSLHALWLRFCATYICRNIWCRRARQGTPSFWKLQEEGACLKFERHAHIGMWSSILPPLSLHDIAPSKRLLILSST